MNLQKTYITLFVLTVSILLAGNFFIYFKGFDQIKNEKNITNKQLKNNVNQYSFIYRLKVLNDSNITKFNDSYETFMKSFKQFKNNKKKDVDTQTLNRIKELTLNQKTINTKLINIEKKINAKRNVEKNLWLETETFISIQAKELVKNRKEILPEIRKKLYQWSNSIPFLDKVKTSIDLSYLKEDQYTELKDLISFTDWLNSIKNNSIELQKMRDLTEIKITQSFINQKVKTKLSRMTKDLFNQIELKRKIIQKKVNLKEKQKDINIKIDNIINNKLLISWQNSLMKRQRAIYQDKIKNYKKIAVTLTIVSTVIIFIMTYMFLSIFPHLKKLEEKSKKIATGEFKLLKNEIIPDNEIGSVMKTFNYMSEEIKNNIAKIKHQEKENTKLINSIQRFKRISEMGEMSAKLAHEFKNPISILSLCVNDAIEGLKKEKYEYCEKELKKCYEIIERLNLIAKNFYIKNKKTKSEKINIVKSLNDLKAMYLNLTEQHEINLNIVHNGLNDYLSLPRLEFLGAVTNLIDNAIEYYKDQIGKAKVITVSINSIDNNYHLSVSNIGEEIKEPELIFNNFYTTKEGINRGLGLNIVKEFIESLGGEINYKHRDGFNCFTLLLPQSLRVS